MKKTLILLFIGILVLLSGCASEDIEHIDEYDSINGVLIYDWDTMTFTNTSTNSIMYGTGNTAADFMLLLATTLPNEDVSLSKETAYIQLLLIIDELVINSSKDYRTILNYSSSDFKASCDDYSIDVTTTNIVTFNSLKSTIIDIKQLDNVNSIRIIDYIEYRLGALLDSEQVDSLNILQSDYNNLVNRSTYLEISSHGLNELIIELEKQSWYQSTPEKMLQLEIAYDIILSLHNN